MAAGAEVRCGSRVSALDVDADGVYATIGLERVHARLVVLACGANYAFQRRFGLGLPRRLSAHGAARAAGVAPVGRRAAFRPPGRSRRLRVGGAGRASGRLVRPGRRDGGA